MGVSTVSRSTLNDRKACQLSTIRASDPIYGHPRSSVAKNLLYVALVIQSIFSAKVWSEDNKPTSPKPKVAILPFGGSAPAVERERAALSFRLKLDRAGVYDPIDGPTMAELVGEKSIDLSTTADDVRKIVATESPTILIWGSLTDELKVNILDLREKTPQPKIFSAPYKHPTDLRFAVEKAIESLGGGKSFEHPDEVAVHQDEKAEKLWKTNPNLLTDKQSTFDDFADWRGILESAKYPLTVSDQDPDTDKIVIRKEGDNQYLAMKLSRGVAESTGLACLGGIIKIEPKTRYRIQFRYKSDGPKLHVFIKGYTTFKGEEREIYRRQVPPTAGTNGKWVTIVDELNPQQRTFNVEYLRIDFYAYLGAGLVCFDDVIIKAVGEPTRDAHDEALDVPTTQEKP